MRAIECIADVLAFVCAPHEFSKPRIIRLQALADNRTTSSVDRFIVHDDFKKYLGLVAQDRLVAILRALFDESAELSARFNHFDRELHRDYETHIGKKSSGWLTAFLLAVRFPQKYIFYRHRLVEFARTNLGYEIEESSSRGERYVAYLAMLNSVKEQLAKEWNRSTDLIDAHSFLWVESARHKEEKNPNGTAPREKKIWKIAPGPNALHWEMCRDRGCIVVAFLEDLDFRNFPDTKSGKQALLDAGQGTPSASAILRFTHRMKPGDIVVANKGVNTVVGIGTIISDYIEPKNPNNPSQDKEYCHSRRVKWLITEPMTFSRRPFIQHAVGRLSPEKWENIKQGYLERSPELRSAFDQLENNTIPLIPPSNDESTDAPELRELIALSAKTKNIILYGPPGTGKTYLVSKFAEHFIRPQLKEPISAEDQRIRTLQGLTWWQAIALAMSVDGQSSFTVPELLSTETMSNFARLKKSAKIGNSVWVQLQSHTSPESRTVKYSNRQQPYLFDKNDQSQWSLTLAGKEYVEENLSEELHQLRNPNTVKTEASNFYEFVTFHQSFAYEEFIEGLKPEITDEGGLTYLVRAGVFKDIATRAEASWRKHGESAPKYLLIVDEINRANIAKVFGELITLIEDDKRLGSPNNLEAHLPYSGHKFGVPPNLYIIGTMNTADRSIALLDLALRRRFSFVEVTPAPSLLKVVSGVDLRALLTKLNERIELLLDRDHRIGHSYLMVQDAAELHFAWFRRVLPLLQEYFYNDSERLYALLGDGFMSKVESKNLPSQLSELVDTDSPRYELKMLNEEDLLSTLSAY